MPKKPKGPHKQNRLSAQRVRSLKEPGLYADGGTLFLRIAPARSKQWVQRIQVQGVRRDIGLGGIDYVSLQEARQKAAENRRIARAGGDPRVRKDVPTFAEAARKLHTILLPTWKNSNHAAQWLKSLEAFAFPVIGLMPVNAVGRKDVLRILAPGDEKGLWQTKNETARRVRSRIRSTLAWAQSEGFIQGQNEADKVIDGALPRQAQNGKSQKNHLPALPHGEVPGFLAAFEATGAAEAAKLLLRFQTLTATRPGEAREAVWTEIDPDKRTWTIPGDRMKGGTQHKVPLSNAALEVLERARALADGSAWLFPSPLKRGQPLSDMSLVNRIRKMRWPTPMVPHGMRSSFKNWCEESGMSDHASEQALAHVVRGVKGAYLRTTVFEQRKTIMEKWATYLQH